MSLFSHEEICEGCIKAKFHKCCGKFCSCEDVHAGTVNACKGTCEFKE